HSKTMIIDDKVVINGSFNFSKNAELNNNEDTLIITSSSFAQNFLKEYARIKDMAIKNTDIPPYDHPACSHGDPSETPVNTNKNSINLSTNEVPYFYDRD
ncbi:MAG: phospholipase D-like domain-containing protein, partial [Cyanobacteriota bacterium]